MVKISANINKKVPLPGVDYSSQSFGAAMEIEISDADRPEVVQQRLRDLYALLSNTIDQQIAAGQQMAPQTPARATAPQRQLRAPGNGYSGQNGAAAHTVGTRSRTVYATQAQQRALYAICKNLNLDIAAVLADYNVADVAQLTVRDASCLIDRLKSQQNGNGQHAQ